MIRRVKMMIRRVKTVIRRVKTMIRRVKTVIRRFYLGAACGLARDYPSCRRAYPTPGMVSR